MSSAIPPKIEQEIDDVLSVARDPVRRFLREGEKIDVPIFGLTGLKLSGIDVEVLDYGDGKIAPIFRDIDRVSNDLFAYLLISRLDDVLHGEHLAFVRKHMRMDEECLGRALGFDRQTIVTCETAAREPLPRGLAHALKTECLLYVHRHRETFKVNAGLLELMEMTKLQAHSYEFEVATG